MKATSLTNVVLLWLASAGIAAMVAWIVFGLLEVASTDEHMLIFAACLVGYGVLGYFIQPAADKAISEGRLGDVWGWGHLYCGEEAFLLSVLLFPGRLIALTFLHTTRLIVQSLRRADSSGGVTS